MELLENAMYGIAMALGVAMYSFLLRYELPKRRTASKAGTDSTDTEQVSESHSLLGSEIGASSRGDGIDSRPDSGRVIDGTFNRLSD